MIEEQLKELVATNNKLVELSQNIIQQLEYLTQIITQRLIPMPVYYQPAETVIPAPPAPPQPKPEYPYQVGRIEGRKQTYKGRKPYRRKPNLDAQTRALIKGIYKYYNLPDRVVATVFDRPRASVNHYKFDEYIPDIKPASKKVVAKFIRDNYSLFSKIKCDELPPVSKLMTALDFNPYEALKDLQSKEVANSKSGESRQRDEILQLLQDGENPSEVQRTYELPPASIWALWHEWYQKIKNSTLPPAKLNNLSQINQSMTVWFAQNASSPANLVKR